VTATSITDSGTLAVTGATTLSSTLAVTGITTVAAGSAALPAIISTTGTADTGLWFPAADTVAASTAGTERVRIDSSGNVGIGTSSPSVKLDVTGSIRASVSVTSASDFIGGGASGYAALYGDAAGGLIICRGSSSTNDIEFLTNSAERMRIDSNGNVGIGGTSPGNRLYILKSDNTNYLTDFANSFSSGNGYINRMNFSGSAPNSTASIFSAMVDTGGSRCIIYANGGIHNYQANNVNLSDRKEKINFAPACEYLSKICAIPVQTFNYIDQNLEEDDGLTLGVVAQDVQAVAPELVSESDWSPEKDGSKMRLSIYQTDLQYALMKCIQELKAIIDTQATRIAALEAK
jgi:hypothetical protein